MKLIKEIHTAEGIEYIYEKTVLEKIFIGFLKAIGVLAGLYVAFAFAVIVFRI